MGQEPSQYTCMLAHTVVSSHSTIVATILREFDFGWNLGESLFYTFESPI